jgi:dihydrofolate reductase
MLISFVVAAGKNNAIGKEGKIPWHLPNDLKFFKNVTWGMPVLMGRKTFEAMGKVLPGRKNIVLTKQPTWAAEGVLTVKSIEDAIFIAKQTDALELMVIGGGEIYKSLIDKARRIYLTRVDAEPEADTFFPTLNAKEWHLMSEKKHNADDRNPYNYSFQVWERYD